MAGHELGCVILDDPSIDQPIDCRFSGGPQIVRITAAYVTGPVFEGYVNVGSGGHFHGPSR
jgi:hypothetical protein